MKHKEKREGAPHRQLLHSRGREIVQNAVQWLLFAALGALLGSASPAFGVRPFGVALAAATGTMFPAVVAGAAIFAVAVRDYMSVAALAVLAILRLAASLIPHGREKRRVGVFGEGIALRVLASSISMFTIGVYALCRANFRLYFLFGLLLGVAVAPLATSLLTGAFLPVDEKRPHVREIGVATLVFLCIFSMRTVSLAGITPAAVAAALIALWLASHRGPLYAALGGLLAGVAFDLKLSPAFLLIALGFLLLERSTRGGGILVGTALAALYTFAVSGSVGVIALLPSLLTAGALFLAGDSAGLVEGSSAHTLSLWRRRASALSARSLALDAQEKRIRGMASALGDLSGLLSEVGGRARRPAASELRHLCDREFDRTCPCCVHRDACWGTEYAATADALCKLADRLRDGRRVSEKDVTESLVLRCGSLPTILSRINEGAQRLEEEAMRADGTSVIAGDYAALARVLNEALETGREEQTIDAELGDRILAALRTRGYVCDGVAVCGRTHRRIVLRSLRLPGRQVKLREVREILESRCRFPLGEASTRESEGAPDVIFAERQRLRATTVKQTRAVSRGVRCGDSVTSFSTEEGIGYAFLCDGMGSGNGAALTSALASTVLSSLLHAGNRADTSLRMLCGVLAARGRRHDEASSTVDLLEIDCVSAEASLFKCGAAPTYLLRRGQTTRFFSRTAPVGILESLDAERLRFRVEPGDVIVQVSDGVTEGEEDCPWLSDMLLTRYDGDAETFARNVLARATQHASDDLSIIITVLEAA